MQAAVILNASFLRTPIEALAPAGALSPPRTLAMQDMSAVPDEEHGARGVGSNGLPLDAQGKETRLPGPELKTEPTDPEKDWEKYKESLRSGMVDEADCQTCSSRKYVDRSSDSSVSYQAPTKISPAMSHFAVRSHEYEHVKHERINAQLEGRKISRQHVQLRHSRCPECGIMYVSGGVTRTVTVKQAEKSYSEPKNPSKNANLDLQK